MNDKKDPSTRTSCLAGEGDCSKMHNDLKWLLGGLFSTIATGIVVIGLPMLWKVAAMETSLQELNNTMKNVVLQDLTELRRRVTVQEQKQILPLADTRTINLEERLRHLELVMRQHEKQSPLIKPNH